MNKPFITAAAGIMMVISLIGPAGATTEVDRPLKNCAATSCDLFNYVTFNSYKNVQTYPGKDEPNFLIAKDGDNEDAAEYTDHLRVRHGQKVIISILVHNNADPRDKGNIARHVRVAADLPTHASSAHKITASVSSPSARPATVTDSTILFSGQPFTVDYIEDSARFLYKNDAGERKIRPVSNPTDSDGTSLGNVYPCFDRAGYVYFFARINMQPQSDNQQPASLNTEVPPIQTPESAAQVAAPVVASPAAPVDDPPAIQHIVSQTQVSQTVEVPAPAPAAVQPPAPAVVSPPSPYVPASQQLPQTGGISVASGMLGMGSMGYALVSYRKSRKNLKKSLIRGSQT